jgi:hypothetical protein
MSYPPKFKNIDALQSAREVARKNNQQSNRLMLQCLPDGQGDDLRCVSFTRWGGVSLPPYNELNVGLNVGDDREAVEENRQIVRTILDAGELISSGPWFFMTRKKRQ